MIKAPPCPGAEQVKLGRRTFWSMGGNVIRFIEEYCVFTNARWTGQPFVLQAWQKRMLWELFEVSAKTGKRRYRRALIGLPRKQGKTELAAAIGLYLMLADGEKSAQLYCAAGNEEQADLVFEAAKRMCSIDGAPLAKMVKVEAKRLTSLADPYSYFERLSSKGATKHGLNPHGVIFDELHVWGVGQHEELWDALTTGSGARDQPLQIAITTAGQDLETSRCGGLYQHGRAMEAGTEEDDSFFFRWWEAPEGCDFRDAAAWRTAMPNFGVTVNEEFLKGELAGTNIGANQRQGAITESAFRRLYLNQWVEYGAAPWVTREQIEACRLPAFELRQSVPTWVGVDLSETRDATAVVAGQLWEGDDRPCGHDGEGCLYIKVRTWEPPRDEHGKIVESWRVPQGEVKQYVRDLNAELSVLTNIFDPWHSRLMQQDLQGEGLVCEEIWQTGARRAGASAHLYDRIEQKRLHFCDDVFERHVMNATVRASGSDGGYYLAKRRAGKPMDAAMATVNVVYGLMFAPVETQADEVEFFVFGSER